MSSCNLPNALILDSSNVLWKFHWVLFELVPAAVGGTLATDLENLESRDGGDCGSRRASYHTPHIQTESLGYGGALEVFWQRMRQLISVHRGREDVDAGTSCHVAVEGCGADTLVLVKIVYP